MAKKKKLEVLLHEALQSFSFQRPKLVRFPLNKSMVNYKLGIIKVNPNLNIKQSIKISTAWASWLNFNSLNML